MIIKNHRDIPTAYPPYRRYMGMPLEDEIRDRKMDYDEGRAEERMIMDEMNDERYSRE